MGIFVSQKWEIYEYEILKNADKYGSVSEKKRIKLNQLERHVTEIDYPKMLRTVTNIY